MTNIPRAIGTAAETAVVRYLRSVGWPHAERRALHGAHDLGDVTGTPGIVWEVKAGRTARGASDRLIGEWLAETDTERANAGADLGVLVLPRPGVGPANVGRWWAILTLDALCPDWATRATPPLLAAPVRLMLTDACAMLRAWGYGSPPEEVA